MDDSFENNIDSIKNIMKRASLKNISSFIAFGGELLENENDITFEQKKQNVIDKLNDILESNLDFEICDTVNDYISELVSINFYIGMKAGAKLEMELISENIK